MHGNEILHYSILYPFGPPAFPAIYLTEQQLVSLVENGMHCCDCANGKCQQLDSMFVKGLLKSLL